MTTNFLWAAFNAYWHRQALTDNGFCVKEEEEETFKALSAS